MGIWQTNLLGGALRAGGAWLALILCAHLTFAQDIQQPRSLGEVAITAEDRAALVEPPVAPSPPPFTEEEADWLPQFTLPNPQLWEELWAPGLLVEDTYWLQRPWSIGFMVGTMTSGDLTSQITESSDWYWGLRLGNDFAPHWGWEFRSAFFSPDLHYNPPVPLPGITNDWFLDLNVLHYPWGDTRWRPYWSVGLGTTQYSFSRGNGLRDSEWVVDLPVALGCKYHWSRAIVLRGELGNTTTFGNGTINALNHVTFNLGAEIHWHSFKTRPVKYGY